MAACPTYGRPTVTTASDRICRRRLTSVGTVLLTTAIVLTATMVYAMPGPVSGVRRRGAVEAASHDESLAATACIPTGADATLRAGRGGRFRLRVVVDNESGRFDAIDAREGVAVWLESRGWRARMDVNAAAEGWTRRGGRGPSPDRDAEGLRLPRIGLSGVRIRDRSRVTGAVVVTARGRVDRSLAIADGSPVAAALLVDSLCAVATTSSSEAQHP